MIVTSRMIMLAGFSDATLKPISGADTSERATEWKAIVKAASAAIMPPATSHLAHQGTGHRL